MFGTNSPMLPLGKCTRQAAELELKPDVREKFMWENADRVFGLGLRERAEKKKAKL